MHWITNNNAPKGLIFTFNLSKFVHEIKFLKMWFFSCQKSRKRKGCCQLHGNLLSSNLDAHPSRLQFARPISNLTFLLKTTGRVVVSGSTSMPTYWSAYWARHSTETAVTLCTASTGRAKLYALSVRFECWILHCGLWHTTSSVCMMVQYWRLGTEIVSLLPHRPACSEWSY